MNRWSRSRLLSGVAAASMLAGTVVAVTPGVAGAAPGDVVNNPGAFTASLYNYVPSIGIPGPSGYTPGISGSFILSGIGGAVDASGPPQCNDGINNDTGQDTKIDFSGGDPECSSAADANEVQTGFQAQANIGATGTVSSTGAVTAVNLSVPEQWVYASGNVANVKVTNNTPPAGSTLNPHTGESLLKADIKAVIKASILTCTINSVKLNLSNYGATPGLPALQPLVGKHLYNQFTGKTTLVDNQYTIPASSGFLCSSQVDPGLGLPAAAGKSIAEVSVQLSTIFQQGNYAPTANAGPTQNVASAASVNLAGSGTDGGDGPLPITYAWTQTAGPAVTLSSTTVANPSFTAPAGPTALTFSLVTNDGLANSAASSVTINVAGPVNVPPTANAGPPQTVASGASVNLAGSGTDPDSGPGPLTYAWTQTAGPAVTLSSTTSATPSFTAPTGPASLTFQLVTNDGAASSSPSSVTITVNAPVNVPPTANAGPTQTVVTGQSVTLDGTGSNDPDSYPGPLTYAWTQTGGQPVTLSSNTAAQPTFTAPAIACSALSFSLTVNDGAASSSPSSVTINLNPASPAVATAYDFNGDGTADRGVYRNGAWLISGQPSSWFGLAIDTIAPGDYDGDGTVNKVVYRSGAWMSAQCPTVYFGNATDVPVPGDYNGDGKDDHAVYRNGAWLTQGQATVYQGNATDIPVPADYDGNGTTDRAVYRSGSWLIAGQPTVNFGNATDIPVPADYNGDGSADIRVFRPASGGWLSPTLPAVWWGRSDTTPVPADYNGDGSAEVMVFFTTGGQWTSPSTPVLWFGVATDVPLSTQVAAR